MFPFFHFKVPCPRALCLLPCRYQQIRTGDLTVELSPRSYPLNHNSSFCTFAPIRAFIIGSLGVKKKKKKKKKHLTLLITMIFVLRAQRAFTYSSVPPLFQKSVERVCFQTYRITVSWTFSSKVYFPFFFRTLGVPRNNQGFRHLRWTSRLTEKRLLCYQLMLLSVQGC